MVPRMPPLRPSAALGLLLCLLAGAASPSLGGGEGGRRLEANGRPANVEIRSPGEKVTFVFALRSGCRYRLTVDPGTLERPVVDLALGEVAQRFGAPERGQPAVFEWDAEGTSVGRAEVQGFSALTGQAVVRLETLGPDGWPRPVPAPWIAPGGERGRVGDLLLGESERWTLVVEPERTYEVEPLRGTAAGVRLAVLPKEKGGAPLAVGTRPWLPFDTLRFRVPASEFQPLPPLVPGPAPPGGFPPTFLPWVLEVGGFGGSGGTYGLRLTRLPDDAALDPPPRAPYPDVPRELVPEEPLGFRLNAGDVAVLYLPAGAGAIAGTALAAQVQGAWVPLGPDAPSATMRTPEGQHLAWFRAEQPGTYRFGLASAAGPGPTRPILVPAKEVTGAPLLIAVTGDPGVRARLSAAWQTIAMGVVMPGFDYLYVAEGAPSEGVAMRVSGLDGKALASRPASGEALTYAQGYGPSLRFRVKAPGLVRLEARGGRQVVRALLRRASN